MRVSVCCVRCRMEVSGVAENNPDEAVARLLNNLGLHLRGRRCRNRRRAMSSESTTVVERGVWRHVDDQSSCVSYPDSFNFTLTDDLILCSPHGRTMVCIPAPSDVAQTGGGPTPHAPAREPLSGFRWPCERRYAHGPHPTPCDQCAEEGHGQCPNACPGVGAHPLTMIGGHYRDDRDA